MRVRHKTTFDEYDLVERDRKETRVFDRNGEYRIFKTDQTEDVTPEPTWVDVTAQCGVIEMCDDIVHNGHIITYTDGYRLRKIAVGGFDYFIVEKRQS